MVILIGVEWPLHRMWPMQTFPRIKLRVRAAQHEHPPPYSHHTRELYGPTQLSTGLLQMHVE